LKVSAVSLNKVGHKNIPSNFYTKITFVYIVTSSTVRVLLAEIKREADNWNYGGPLYGVYTWNILEWCFWVSLFIRLFYDSESASYVI
jgi:hypothetical protein